MVREIEEEQPPIGVDSWSSVRNTPADRSVKEFSVSFTSAAGNTRIASLALLDGEIMIQYDDSTSIKLGSSGIEIVTNEEIEVIAGERIELESEKVVSVEAEEKIEIFGEDCFVELSPTEIKMSAEDIEINS